MAFFSFEINAQISVDTCKYLKAEAEWYYTPWSLNFEKHLHKIEIIADTIIGDRLCSILGVFEDSIFTEGSELIVFYELDKVYFYEDEQFKILYDFSHDIQSGDTVTFYLPQNYSVYDISSSQGLFYPTKKPYQAIVLDVVFSELEDGGLQRITTLQPLCQDSEDCFGLGSVMDGIGGKFGLLGKGGVQLPSGSIEYFRCFNSSKHSYTEVDGQCELRRGGTATSNITNEDVKVFPNPFTDVISIQSPIDFDKMILQTINGKVVKSESFENKMSTKNLSAGIYILTLINESERGVYSVKISKQAANQ